MNTLTTSHKLVIEGCNFEIVGYHEFRYRANSKMSFDLHLLKEQGYIGRKNIRTSDIRKIALELITNDAESKKRDIYYNRFKDMTLIEIMNHVDFRYGRIIVGGSGNYVNIYCSDIYSPTGVSLITGCSEVEFDIAAKETNNEHNYLVGSEGRNMVW